MKKTTTLFAAMIVAIGAAFATEGEKSNAEKVALVKWKADTHRLFYLSKTSGKVKVRILDDNGNTVLSKNVKNERGFALPLNFRKQKAGDFTIKVTDEQDTYTESFEVTKR